MEKDRILAAKILASKGFLRTLVAKDLNLPQAVFEVDAIKKLRGEEAITEIKEKSKVDAMEGGISMTLENMKAKFPQANDGEKMWYDQSWYDNEDFFKNETPKAGWKLVSKEIITDSTSKNYLEQTEIIINHIKEEVFKNKQIPDIYKEAIDEFESQKTDIAEVIDSDWRKVADKLEKLQITWLTRENPAEVMYRLILQDQENKEKLLPSKYTWTLRRASDGEFVDVGSFDSDGAIVHGSAPNDRDGHLGVSFSRSL